MKVPSVRTYSLFEKSSEIIAKRNGEEFSSLLFFYLFSYEKLNEISPCPQKLRASKRGTHTVKGTR